MKNPMFMLCVMTLFIGRVVAEETTESVCTADTTVNVNVTIDPDSVLRKSVPSTLFGFAMGWHPFQEGYFRDGQVRSEVVSWLKPFSGAIYRYIGPDLNNWQYAVGNISSRSYIPATYSASGYAFPYFGPAEYISFLNQVDGKGIIMLDMISHGTANSDEVNIVNNGVALVDWVKNQSGLGCVSGSKCRIKYWELGNEPDWASTQWSGSEYYQRTDQLVSELKANYSGIALLAAGKTAPWESPAAADTFNYTVANLLGKQVAGVTMHPYYDGRSIPDMTSWLLRTVKAYRLFNSSAKMVVTEHGRWPTQVHDNWQDDWYLASGSGGAISSADFIISAAKLSYVEAAAWHALAASGPWQLFHQDRSNDELYPSAVYWGLRAIREGFLQDRIAVTPEKTTDSSYVGNYGLNLLAMKASDGRVSLLGVNRSDRAALITIGVKNQTADVYQERMVKFNYFVADTAGSDNTDEDKYKFLMNTQSIATQGALPSQICIPPRSSFSII